MKVGIIGGSGYVGGELLRLLLLHPQAEIMIVTSRKYKGDFIHRVHPNLRGMIDLKFKDISLPEISESCDLVFFAMSHGASSKILPQFLEMGLRVIDTGADFRLKDPLKYEMYYKWTHPYPEILQETVYGIPELHRKEIKTAKLVACPGCMAISSILALAPIIKTEKIEKDRILIDTKIGSSGSGATPSLSTHHPERSGVIRPYSPVGHRHTPEIEQELSRLAESRITVSMSAHAINNVRGILATCHVFLKSLLTIKDIWRLYRDAYEKEPFIRFVRDRKGVYRFPDPKITIGSNFCDIGFEIENQKKRLVIMSAIDNLVKGAAGTAIQNMNLMFNLDEKSGLWHPGLHPV
jgi:N-acetyl-gamma-glutamyl-phosphate/LysW-gamma-L-alpha-aminoadipyl-6-phosphate reductase